MKPSQRRSRPSRVTSRCPTASAWPRSSSTTATCRRRRSNCGGAEHGRRGIRYPRAIRDRTVAPHSPANAARCHHPPIAASASSPSAAASARSYPGSALRLAIAAPLPCSSARASASCSDLTADSGRPRGGQLALRSVARFGRGCAALLGFDAAVLPQSPALAQRPWPWTPPRRVRAPARCRRRALRAGRLACCAPVRCGQAGRVPLRAPPLRPAARPASRLAAREFLPAPLPLLARPSRQCSVRSRSAPHDFRYRPAAARSRSARPPAARWRAPASLCSASSRAMSPDSDASSRRARPAGAPRCRGVRGQPRADAPARAHARATPRAIFASRPAKPWRGPAQHAPRRSPPGSTLTCSPAAFASALAASAVRSASTQRA